MTPGFSCFSRLVRYFESGNVARNYIKTRFCVNYLIRPHFWPGQKCHQSTNVLCWLFTRTETWRNAVRVSVSESYVVFSSFFFGKGLEWLEFRVKSEVWFSFLAALDQLSLAYLKGNINFPIYSLKLVVVAPCWSGKAPSVLIILTVGEGKGCEMPLGELWAISAPFGEVC